MLCESKRCRFHETLSFEENIVHWEALEPLGRSSCLLCQDAYHTNEVEHLWKTTAPI